VTDQSQREHLGELLSAHLDGELTADETARVEQHLADCAECAAELEATRTVRGRLRGAPAVDPPFGFLERLSRPAGARRAGRSRWIAAASVVTIAAAWIVVLGLAVAPQRSTVAPPVDETRTALAKPGLVASLHRPEGTATRFPTEVLGRPLLSVFAVNQGKLSGDAAIYGEEDDPSSLVQVSILPATPEWSSLKGGLRQPVQGVPGTPWESTDDNPAKALVFSVDGTTVMIVGQVSQADLEQAAATFGHPGGDSFGDRLRSGAWSVVEAFG